MAHFILIPPRLFDEGLKHSDIAIQIIFFHLEALQECPGTLFLSHVPKSVNKVKDKVIPQPFIRWGHSSLVDLISQMVRILMTPLIDRISFDVT